MAHWVSLFWGKKSFTFAIKLPGSWILLLPYHQLHCTSASLQRLSIPTRLRPQVGGLGAWQYEL